MNTNLTNETMNFPVITFIGSMKFWDDFLKEASRLHSEGNVIMLPFKDDNEDSLSEEQRRLYDIMIRAQIDMADEVHVINKNGYIGISTRTELEYAKDKGKIISYMEEPRHQKIVTLCGPYKFMEQFMSITKMLTLEGVIVFTPIACTIPMDFGSLSKKQIEIIHNIHYQKIEMADEVWIVDVDGYIGEDTNRELAYARKLNKKIVHYDDIKNLISNWYQIKGDNNGK